MERTRYGFDPERLPKLQEALGYQFHTIGLLEQALTRRQEDSERNLGRLQWLGDAVIELCLSELIYLEHPKAQPSALMKLIDELSEGDYFLHLALRLEIDRLYVVPPTEQALVKILEAIFAAVQLDGGYVAALNSARHLLLRAVSLGGEASDEALRSILGADEKARLRQISRRPLKRDANVRTMLGLYLSKFGFPNPRYVIKSRNDVPWSLYQCDLWIGRRLFSIGVGHTKPAAQKDAAQSAYLKRHMLFPRKGAAL